jgi:outer membrane protein OmpA-like peptidoglycan-associated protein
MGGAPPLPVETGPRESKPAGPYGETAKTAVPPSPEPVSAAASKPKAPEPPPAVEPAKAELQPVAPPPAATAPPGAQPAAPAQSTAAAASAAAEPFRLKDFTVNFAQNSADIGAAARESLAKAAALLKTNPRTAGIIEGHTDSTGDAGYNKFIAENRAVSVRNYLIAQGVDPSRLSVSSFGSEKPVDSNSTAEGRSKNRRVVIRIVPGKQG